MPYEHQFGTYHKHITKISLGLSTDPIQRSVWDLLQTQYEHQFGTYYGRNTKISLGLITGAMPKSVWDLLQTQYEDQFGTLQAQYEDQFGTDNRRNTKIIFLISRDLNSLLFRSWVCYKNSY